ncbi:hypothetical protein O6H91_15G037900 [Diphasiastrum complanatum]|uniref:Uncharacterized protein n=1 Tax=Diphasiastrum complanatum TaxID=34168 RepID=A0ACC2BHF1_DIPCM|nr:hypothetical protein O6H91_15G037900 [Diphasiastrum complanatum]
MSGQGLNGASSQRPNNSRHHDASSQRGPSLTKKKTLSQNGNASQRRTSISGLPRAERTVKNLRLSKALTIPDHTSVAEACRRMVHRRVDAALLTDSTSILCGIVTDKDVARRVIAEGLKPEETPVSKIMTRSPIFVLSDTLAVDGLQKMVQGKFRHLPVVENGEVIALLDITKCLYDAISRMERAAEKGNAIAAAVEAVERQWGQSSFIDSLRERIFQPTISSLLTEAPKVATVMPTDTVQLAAKKMRDLHVNSAIVTTGSTIQGILTSKDILTRVVAARLKPGTAVEKVMTPNPECASLGTTIVEALHTMHDGKFLHLPVLGEDGSIVACVDVLELTHAAFATVGGGGGSDGLSNSVFQKFWDSAFSLESPDDDTRSEMSSRLIPDVRGADAAAVCHSSSSTSPPPSVVGFSTSTANLDDSFMFKLEDQKGQLHRFRCGSKSLSELASNVKRRLGKAADLTWEPQILYADDEGDRVLLHSDSDLAEAVDSARLLSSKGIRLFLRDSLLDDSHAQNPGKVESPILETHKPDTWTSTHTAVAAGAATGAAMMIGLTLVLLMKRSSANS